MAMKPYIYRLILCVYLNLALEYWKQFLSKRKLVFEFIAAILIGLISNKHMIEPLLCWKLIGINFS